MVIHNVFVCMQGLAGRSRDGHSQCACMYTGVIHNVFVVIHNVRVVIHKVCVCICRGLLGGHVMASYFKRRGLGLSWYNDELLSRAKEVGDRLLPAFNTSTGIPYPRVSVGLICKPNPVPY